MDLSDVKILLIANLRITSKFKNRKRGHQNKYNFNEGVYRAHLLFYVQSPDFHKLGLCY